MGNLQIRRSSITELKEVCTCAVIDIIADFEYLDFALKILREHVVAWQPIIMKMNLLFYFKKRY